MNKLIVFMLGSCSTFSIHLGLMYVNWWDMLFTHAMSLVTYSGAYPFTFRQPIKHKIAFKSTILYPFIP